MTVHCVHPASLRRVRRDEVARCPMPKFDDPYAKVDRRSAGWFRGQTGSPL